MAVKKQQTGKAKPSCSKHETNVVKTQNSRLRTNAGIDAWPEFDVMHDGARVASEGRCAW